VWGDAQVAHAGIVGQDDVERGRGATRAGPLIEEMGHGVGTQGAAGEGRLEVGGTAAIEQAEQGVGVRGLCQLAAPRSRDWRNPGAAGGPEAR
jgi:hypothetical protein